jgi:siroheme synthase (precorrin-2 oxidase/ferrochelatase)
MVFDWSPSQPSDSTKADLAEIPIEQRQSNAIISHSAKQLRDIVGMMLNCNVAARAGIG